VPGFLTRLLARFLISARQWLRAGRAVVLAVGATVAGTRFVTSTGNAAVIASYGVAALLPWVVAGADQHRTRADALARASVQVLVVHAGVLVAGVAWALSGR
jgi:hypothetical protein